MPILEKELKMLLGDKLDESGTNRLRKISTLAGGELGGTEIVDRPKKYEEFVKINFKRAKSIYSIRYKKPYRQ